MKVFASSEYYAQFLPLLQESGSDIEVGRADIKRYPNGELYAYIHDEVEGEACMVIGTIAPPDEQLLMLLTLVEALNRNGAISVTVFVPYLAYARQDKAQEGESGGIAFISTLLRASGVDRIIAVDIHSKRDMRLMDVPVRSLSPAPLFAAEILKLGWRAPTIVAPDEGAVSRAQKLAGVFGDITPIAHLVKRHVDSVVHTELVGEVGENVVVVDDILDSGRTLVSACQMIRQRGAARIVVAVTHGLFTSEDWGRVFDLGVEALFVSESCPEAAQQHHPRVHLVSLAPLLPKVVSLERIKEVHNERAVV